MPFALTLQPHCLALELALKDMLGVEVDPCFAKRRFSNSNSAPSRRSFDKRATEVKIGAETFYKIANYDAMRPFFMSIVSHSNHWMFLSSTGGLTAGRKNKR